MTPAAAPVQRQDRRGAPALGDAFRGGALAEGQREGSSVGETVAEASGGRADLRALSLGFELPAGRSFSSDPLHTLATHQATRIDLRVSRDRLQVGMWPPMMVDATFPIRNSTVSGCGWDFARGEPVIHVQDAGMGAIPSAGRVRTRIHDMLRQTLGSTPLGRPGYDPLSDREVMTHLMALRRAFEALPASPGATEAPLEARDPSAGATLAMRAPFVAGSGEAQMTIPAGGTFTATVRTSGDARAAVAGGSAAGALAALQVTELDLESSNITILNGNSPVARLLSLRVLPGGVVQVLNYEALGGAALADGLEGLASLFGGGSRGPGVVRRRLEEGLSGAVRSLVLENRQAIPGVDLASVLGVR